MSTDRTESGRGTDPCITPAIQQLVRQIHSEDPRCLASASRHPKQSGCGDSTARRAHSSSQRFWNAASSDEHLRACIFEVRQPDRRFR